MGRFILHAVPLLVLLLALFGFAVELLDVEPRRGSVIRLALFEQPRVPAVVVLGTWLMEAAGLTALYLLARGRCGAWWLDGLVAGWTAWIFRGPLLVITIVVAARQPQEPWWTLAFGWWVLYSVCGLSLAVLERRQTAAERQPSKLVKEGETLAVTGRKAPPEIATRDAAETEAARSLPGGQPEAIDGAPLADEVQAPARADDILEAAGQAADEIAGER